MELDLQEKEREEKRRYFVSQTTIFLKLLQRLSEELISIADSWDIIICHRASHPSFFKGKEEKIISLLRKEVLTLKESMNKLSQCYYECLKEAGDNNDEKK